MNVLHWFVLLSLVGLVQSEEGQEDCEVSYQKIGCYKEKRNDRALAKLLLNVRDEIKWKPGEWEKFLKRLACRCAKLSRVLGQSHFGLQFYGECWSDELAFERFDRHGKSDPEGCVGFQYKKCNDDEDDNECVGGPNKNYVYKILEEGGSGSGSGSGNGILM